jgi:hypothetical protein
MAARHHRQRRGVGADIGAGRPARALDGQVVALGRLVEELGDDAGGVGAERVLLGCTRLHVSILAGIMPVNNQT